jgi:hypothetical protein
MAKQQLRGVYEVALNKPLFPTPEGGGI